MGKTIRIRATTESEGRPYIVLNRWTWKQYVKHNGFHQLSDTNCHFNSLNLWLPSPPSTHYLQSPFYGLGECYASFRTCSTPPWAQSAGNSTTCYANFEITPFIQDRSYSHSRSIENVEMGRISLRLLTPVSQSSSWVDHWLLLRRAQKGGLKWHICTRSRKVARNRRMSRRIEVWMWKTM